MLICKAAFLSGMMADVPNAGCDKREQNTNNPLMFSGDFKRENRVLSTANGLLGKSKVRVIKAMTISRLKRNEVIESNVKKKQQKMSLRRIISIVIAVSHNTIFSLTTHQTNTCLHTWELFYHFPSWNSLPQEISPGGFFSANVLPQTHTHTHSYSPITLTFSLFLSPSTPSPFVCVTALPLPPRSQ